MKRTKETKRRWGRVAVVLALIGGMVLVLAGPTSAADDEPMATDTTMAADVVDVFMSDQGVTIDGPLRVTLEAEIASAFEVGAMLWTTLNELGFGWSSAPSTTDADPTAPLPGELLRERIRERIQEQLRIWDVVAPEWHEVYERLQERVRDCREEGDDSCWAELRLRLQYEHALRFHEGYESDYGSMQSNGGTPNELAELERLRERTEDRVQAMIDDVPEASLGDLGIQLGDLAQLRDRLRDQVQIHDMTSTSSSSSSSTPDDDSDGRGGN